MHEFGYRPKGGVSHEKRCTKKITADDVAYIQACYWDAGGWCLSDDNYAVYVAVGKEHFYRLQELGGPDFVYPKKSKMGSEAARLARLSAFFKIEDALQ